MIGATSPFLAFLWIRAANCGSLSNAIDWRETAGRGASPWIHISIIGLGWRSFRDKLRSVQAASLTDP